MITPSASTTLMIAALLVASTNVHVRFASASPIEHPQQQQTQRRGTASIISIPPRFGGAAGQQQQHTLELRSGSGHHQQEHVKRFNQSYAIHERERIAKKYSAAVRERAHAAIVAMKAEESLNDAVEKVFSADDVNLTTIGNKGKGGKALASEPFDVNGAKKTSAKGTTQGKTSTTPVKITSGKDALVDSYDGVDILYYGPLSIGTPAQTTTIDFDTGSSDLVMPLTACKPCTGPTFNTALSSTYVVSKTSFSIQYEDGSGAKGKVATDTVSVAGLTVVNQGFAAISTVSGGFGEGPNAGLLGLGFPANANSGKTPFFTNLANNAALASNVFSVFMTRDGGTGSELCLGCMDSSKYTGIPAYYALDKTSTGGTQYYWNIISAGLTYNGGTATGSFSAVIDTGTTLIYVPTATATKFYAQVPGAKAATGSGMAGFYTYPCANNLAPIAFKFGTTNYAVNIADFNLGLLSDGSTLCVGGIVGQNVEFGSSLLAIVGDEFMKSWYTIFDLTNNRVGLAASV